MMKVWYSSASKPGSRVRPPNTAVRPSMKIVGASTPGIAAPGTRRISLRARRTASSVARTDARTAVAVLAAHPPQRSRRAAPAR